MDRAAIKEIYRRMVGEFLFPLLESRGYRRGAGGWYYKRDAEREFRIAPNLTSRGKNISALYSVGAAVAFLKLWEFLRQSGISDFYREGGHMYTWAACGGEIIRMLPRELEPLWQYITDMSDPEILGNELVAHFKIYVFPYLDYHSNLKNAAASETCGFDPMPRAGAYHLLGERQRAITILDAREKDMEANYERRRILSARAGRAVPTDVVPEDLAELRKFREFLKAH